TTTSTTSTTDPCGNGTVDTGEDCDPPGSSCAGAFTGICQADCSCPTTTTTTETTTTTTETTTTTTTTTTMPPSSCGNAFLDPGEECDPPGSTSTQCPSSPAGAFLRCNPDCTCCVPQAEICGNLA